MKVRLHLLSFLLVFAGLAVAAGAAPKPLYFTSPEQAATRTTELLRAKDWAELARYYDLAGTEIARSDLQRGTFFVRANPPPNADAGGLWKFREPFAPGYEFIAVARADEPGVHVVTVGLASEPQRGRVTFYLRQTPAGFQLLPNARPPRVPNPAHAATGGISVQEAAWRAGIDYVPSGWHSYYSGPLTTWFFASAKAAPVALERKAAQWVVRPLPAVDVVAVDALGSGPDGATLFDSVPGDFWDLVLPGEPGRPELVVPREKIWPLLERARELGWKLKWVGPHAYSPPDRAVLTLVHP